MGEVGNQAPRAWFPKGRGIRKSYAGRRGPQPSQFSEEEEEESGVVAQSQGFSKSLRTGELSFLRPRPSVVASENWALRKERKWDGPGASESVSGD